MEIIELRRYALRPGMRDTLIRLFEREFLESQEACGMLPIGHYRDLDDPNSFVWFRGFESMEIRRRALEAFYLHSPAWRSHRDEANATMLNSDDVLLLRDARPNSGFDLSGLHRDNEGNRDRFVAASVFMLDEPASDQLLGEFEQRLLPALREHAERICYFVTDDRPNDFPRLPVREGEWAFVLVGICPNRTALDEWSRLAGNRCQTLRLAPAPRSLFR